MSHQVCFQKARNNIVPIGKSPYRYLMFQKASRTSGGDRFIDSFPLWPE